MSAVAVTITTQDVKGKAALSKVHVPTSFTLDQYVDFANGFAQVMANLQDGTITEIGVSVPVDVSLLFAVAGSLADAAEKGFFSVATTVSGLFTKYILPMFDRTKVIAGSDQIDVEDSDIAALVSAYEDGITTTGGTWHLGDSRGNEDLSLSSARGVFLERS